MPKPLQTSRPGFTLVELLVVITLMLVIAGLAVLVIPRVQDDQKATNAATNLQQWLEIAKNRAARDRAPRGLRLLPGNPTATQVTDCVFLVQSDDYYLGSVERPYVSPPALPAAANAKKMISSRATLSNVGGAGQVTFDMVDPTAPAVPVINPAIPRTVTGGPPNPATTSSLTAAPPLTRFSRSIRPRRAAPAAG